MDIVEKDAFAIITAVRKHRHYLIGKRFTIGTDSRILTYIQAKKTPKNRKLLGWSLELSEFNFDIVHIPSRNNTISDCLSRIDSVKIFLNCNLFILVSSYCQLNTTIQILNMVYNMLLKAKSILM